MRSAAGWPRRLARGALSVLLAGLLGLTSATTYRLLAPGEIVARADLVFTGRVVDVVAEFREDKAYPGVYTTVTFDVDELFRGFGLGEPESPDDDAADGSQDESPEDDVDLDLIELQNERLELDFLGGTAPGDERLIVAGSPTWRTGETVLVAAHLEPDLASPLVGFRQGLWRLVDDAYVDADGLGLGLDPSGRLARTDLPGAPAEVLAAVRAVISGELPPEPASEETAEDSAEETSEAQPEEVPEEPAAEPDGPEAPPAEPAEPGTPADEPEQPEEPDTPEAEPEEPQPDEPGAATEGPVEPIAVSYRVDDSGGPLLLSDAVTAAVTEWRSLAGDAVLLSADSGASNALAYGPAALFPPDTLSLTLVDETGAVTALLSPAAGDLLGRALHHELGLILGLPSGGTGVMAMAVDDGAAVPSGDDLQALLAVNRYLPADLSQDGTVDFDDLLLFAINHGRSGLNLPGDLDRDGDVDDDDLEILRQDYRLTPPRRP